MLSIFAKKSVSFLMTSPFSGMLFLFFLKKICQNLAISLTHFETYFSMVFMFSSCQRCTRSIFDLPPNWFPNAHGRWHRVLIQPGSLILHGLDSKLEWSFWVRPRAEEAYQVNPDHQFKKLNEFHRRISKLRTNLNLDIFSCKIWNNWVVLLLWVENWHI